VALATVTRLRSRTPASKILPPALPAAWVDRPELLRRLDDVGARQLVTVVAGAGFGKSTLLAAWVARVHAAWYSLAPEDASLPNFLRGLMDALRLRLPNLPDALGTALASSLGPDAEELAPADGFAAALGQALELGLSSDLVLVLDDVHELPTGGPSARLVEGLARHAPARFHLVLSSRAEPPFPIQRLRGRGQVLEVDGGLLALGLEETGELLAAALGPDGRELSEPVHRMTGGWPAAICLAVESLRHQHPRERAASMAALRRPGGLLFGYLAEEVLAREDPVLRELVRRVAPLRRFTAELCRAIGVDADAAMLARLARRGLFVQSRSTVDGWFVLNDLVREVVLASMPLEPGELRVLHRRAASWLATGGHLEEALASVVACDDPPATAAFLVEHGSAMLASGATDGVVAAAAGLPAELRSAAVEQVEGEARQVKGDWQGALECFRRAAGNERLLAPGLAWRTGLIHYMRSELNQALEAFRRARLDGAPDADQALLLAWTATVHFLRNEADACREAAKRALAAATACGDDRALAAAHTAMAMLAALEGDRAANDAHYLRALQAAERAGDVLQLARIRANLGSRSTEEGFYREALVELEAAVRLAELSGYAAFLALAQTNRGEAQLGLGRLDEAIAELEAATVTYQRMGSHKVAYPLGDLGLVYRERGDLALAKAAYEEAVGFAEPSGDLQGLVPALAGLARVLAGDEPDRAAELADRALGYGPGMAWVEAQLAAGWVALAAGERERASAAAAAAADAAGTRRDRAGLAEALELRALAAPDPAGELARLREAASIWAAIGNRLGEARNALAQARLAGSAAGDWGTSGFTGGPGGVREARSPAVEQAERRLRALGLRVGAEVAAGLLRAVAAPPRDPVRIQALGGFRVVRAGKPVPVQEWQSRKARELLKVLVARRGHAVPREALMEALWPDEDPARLSNRLSVALSTVRTVLDPERRYASDRFVQADKHVVGLAHLPVDVEEFLASAATGLDRFTSGERAEALSVLASAETAYTGDFLEDDPYEDWAVSLREEARAVYLAVARILARAAAAAGEHDLAVRYHLRMLERDAYDEEAHLGLVATLAAAGRHGEARRRYRIYGQKMDDLGVEPTPFPSASGPTPVTESGAFRAP
jgi:ATP/maltotriose-dependent transcriptional regulator MalT/DNA-binding SARP family transcriptional activator